MRSHISSKPLLDNIQMESFICQNFIFRGKSNSCAKIGRGICICSGNGSLGIGDKSITTGSIGTVLYPAVNKCKGKKFLFIGNVLFEKLREIFIGNWIRIEDFKSIIDERLNVFKWGSILENTETLTFGKDFTAVVTTVEPSTSSCWSSKIFVKKFG